MIRDAATQRQVDAADPAHSTWLSANAGSGKTRVLTDRVARLLLEGVDPQNILCLTYTKAAASEMQNRLFKRLGDWAMMDEARLRAQLRDLGAEGDLGTTRLRKARTLFAQAMETPGGLKIQTIHSFCAGLLRRFPLEAGVSPQFTEMEDRAAELLRAEVVDGIAMGPQGAVIEGLARYFTGEDFDTLLEEIAGERQAFLTMPSDGDLRAAFDIAPSLSAERLLDEVLTPQALTLIADTIMLCAKGSVSDVKASEKLAGVNFTDPALTDLIILEDVFLTGDAAKIPFSAKIDSFPTKAVRASSPDLIAALNDLMQLVEDARGDRQALMAFDRTRALYRFGTVFVEHYEAAKLRRGMLDFDDLIGKARQLLTDPAVAQWVLFRLDGGIDHILVDEAQDTSPGQWAVIQSLAQEFAAGEGARPDRDRTIFVVGDKKQSIYSFQGADPEAFDRMQTHFGTGLQQIGKRLNGLTLDYSFRSSTAILRVVDLVFQGPHLDGLGPDKSYHVAFKELMPGRVDLWPPVPPVKDEKEERAWTDPVDKISERHHDVILAEQIADRVAEMVKSGTIPAEDGQGGFAQRRISEGDILILVQRRSDLFAEIIRALKARKLRVAGADRLRVGAEMAVRDIGALLRFLALPEDDLSLAAVLKSPLFGWTEQQLFTLAHHRPEKSFLWSALRDGTHPDTWSVLQDLLDQADFLRPYDLINRLLTRHDGRRKLLARLGAEAEDGIDALLAQALAFESSAIPDLTGFIEWMETDDLQIKRQMDASGDRIRVMTVHGAKGLESPIVILPDTAKRAVRMTDAIYPASDLRLWATTMAQMPPAMRSIRDAMVAAQERERRRLLYVAMTRAESWLIVCAAGDVGQSGDSWHSMVAEGMGHAGAVTHDFGREEAGLRYSVLDWTTLPRIDRPTTPASPPEASNFGILAPYAAAEKTLTPSALGGTKIMQSDNVEGDNEVALARGTVVHLLLEHLHSIPPDQRTAYANQLLALAPDLAIAGDPAPLITDAIRIIDNPALAALFAPGTLAEVDLTASLPDWGNRRLHGAIDRLVVRPDSVTAIDFKTNRKTPQTPEDVPEGILRQMGAYHAMLHQIYPDRAINVAILWTATAVLMPLSPALVMAALQRASVP